MDFNILYGNLTPHLWEMVSDSVRFVRLALEANGATVRVGTNQLDPGAINLFFDRFYDDPGLPLRLKTGGVRYGLICSEAISPDGVWNYGAENEPPGTFAAFEMAARNADFVWCMLPESLTVCRTLNERAAHLPFGYLDAMDTLADVAWEQRDIDALLVGMPCPRRAALADALEASGVRLCHPGIPVPATLRDALLERSRLQLSVQKTDRHRIVSVTRICHSLANRVPLLLETPLAEGPYAKACLIAPMGGVAEAVHHHLANTDLEAWARARYDEFRQTMPMAPAMARVLNETVSF